MVRTKNIVIQILLKHTLIEKVMACHNRKGKGKNKANKRLREYKTSIISMDENFDG